MTTFVRAPLLDELTAPVVKVLCALNTSVLQDDVPMFLELLLVPLVIVHREGSLAFRRLESVDIRDGKVVETTKDIRLQFSRSVYSFDAVFHCHGKGWRLVNACFCSLYSFSFSPSIH